MENDGGRGDDQSSGWCEVKKRHRSNSKLSLQKISGLNRPHSSSLCSQASTNDKVLFSDSRQQFQLSNTKPDCAARLDVRTDGLLSVQTDLGNDKLAVEKEGGPSRTPLADLEGGRKATLDVSVKENLDGAPKIKWGNLEDDVLSLNELHGDSSGSPETECSVINGNLQEYGNALTHEKSESHGSINTPFQERKATVPSADVGQVFAVILSPVVPEESLGATQNEFNDISSENTKPKNSNQNVVSENTKRCQNGLDKTSYDESGPGLGPLNVAIDVHSSLSAENTKEATLQGPQCETEDQTLQIPEVSEIIEKTSMNVDLQDEIALPQQKISDGFPDHPSVTAAMEERRGLQDKSIGGAYAEEREPGESKERFRERLWCFLFENLNRAVDELYLLCELECDMEQMNEAILVLGEAASDFRELKSRVENFEITKRSPKHSSRDGMPVNVKAEHRRPHALSWEVRRMTTSPHRAEILSSSLEAFKKIQMERSESHTADLSRNASIMESTTQDSSEIPKGSLNTGPNSGEPGMKSGKNTGITEFDQQRNSAKKQNVETAKLSKASSVQNGNMSVGKFKREPLEPISESEKKMTKKDRVSSENRLEKPPRIMDVKRHNSLSEKDKEKEKEKRNPTIWKSMDAWKEKRNWEDILKSPVRATSRVSHSPGMSKKVQDRERARVLHDKLMSPEKKKKNALDLKREAEEKHARAMRIRSQLENERVQRLQRTSAKLNRVNEWQAVRSLKLREGMYARHQRSESRHEAYLAQVARRAGDESHKVNEVRFITSLNEENKKLMLRQKLHDSETRRAEKLQIIRTKQKEDMAREEAVMERRKLLEAEKLQRLAEIQRKKEEAQVRREEERKASSAAREARAVEQLRRKEIRVKAQQEEAELLAQKLAEKLRESEQRRKYYLEQIREKASMDFRDQSSPLLRRSLNKDGQVRSASNSTEDAQTAPISGTLDSALGLVSTTQQQSLKRKIKKIRQRLMALKHDFTEPSVGAENTGIGHRALVGAARAKIGRWLQDLQRLRQARKEGASSIGLIVGDMIKFLEGKDPELHASRQAGLLDFISSALPASHTSKPEACQVTIFLLRLLRVALSLSANRNYFLVQNLLPPIIPMLSASLENYIKIAASSNPGNTSILPSKTSIENLESIAEVLEGFLWIVTVVVGHVHYDERQRQMKDGLTELTVAYQVIHRLRDLFALYDRPQVEGSPFPSSILLSLNLLSVLTSRPGTISSIDWDLCTSKADSRSLVQVPNLEKHTGVLGESSVINSSSGICFMVENTPINEPDQVTEEEKLVPRRGSLPDIVECIPSHGGCHKTDSNVFADLDSETASSICIGVNSGVLQNMVLDERAKPLVVQKDDKSSIDNGEEKKGITECAVYDNNGGKKEGGAKQPVVYLLSAVAETALVSLPSLLTAVLLQANNRISSEQASYILPLNFEEVATGVLKVLNNLALLDLSLLQSMLARSDLQMEFFHLMSFLLSHCTNKWKAANDQVGLLLLECLLLLGYFALFHSGNQAVLRWGKTPTILHKVCDLPFVFFSDPELIPILAGTLVAACYGCDQNKGVIQQELSTEMLLSLLKLCRQGLLTVQSESLPLDSLVANGSFDGNQTIGETRKPHGDLSVRSIRRSSRASFGKGNGSGSYIKASRTRTQRDSRVSKTCDEWALKHNLPASEPSLMFMLHQRFPAAFLDKAEKFFSADISS